MAKLVMRIYSDVLLNGTRNRMGSVKGLGYFVHIPPEKRKNPSAHLCPVGGERTRDYWYCHNTGSQGDVKLCRAHEVEEVYDQGADIDPALMGRP